VSIDAVDDLTFPLKGMGCKPAWRLSAHNICWWMMRVLEYNIAQVAGPFISALCMLKPRGGADRGLSQADKGVSYQPGGTAFRVHCPYQGTGWRVSSASKNVRVAAFRQLGHGSFILTGRWFARSIVKVRARSAPLSDWPTAIVARPPSEIWVRHDSLLWRISIWKFHGMLPMTPPGQVGQSVSEECTNPLADMMRSLCLERGRRRGVSAFGSHAVFVIWSGTRAPLSVDMGSLQTAIERRENVRSYTCFQVCT
jgi:hypothetical protein